MREFMFRVWDIKNKCWLSNFQIMPGGEVRHLKQLPECMDRLEWQSINGEEVVIQQFTGMHDNTKWNELCMEKQELWLRNYDKKDWKGFKIFEGDIAKDALGISEVRWNQDNCEYELIAPTEAKAGVLNRGLEVKIIGNIFENGELLE